MNTIFTSILRGEADASVVYRDSCCMAFMDIHPISPGHVLVVPEQAVTTLAELDPGLSAHLWNVAQRVAGAQQRALGSVAQHILINDGPGANQTVPHVHLHVIPRYRGDGLRSLWRMIAHVGMVALAPPIRRRTRISLDAQAAAIARILEQTTSSRASTEAVKSASTSDTRS